MQKRGLLQTTALVMGYLSEVLAVICLVMLVIKSRQLGIEDVVSASFLASAFFFFTCGLVLIFIGKADVSNLKFDGPEQNTKNTDQPTH